VSQNGDTAKAINYPLNQWAALTLQVDDGAAEIDSNTAETLCESSLLVKKTSCALWLRQ
jgi:transposase